MNTMPISRIPKLPGVATTAKHSILNDIDVIISRVNKVLKGDQKFLDLRTKSGLIALRGLRDARSALEVGLIPTHAE